MGLACEEATAAGMAADAGVDMAASIKGLAGVLKAGCCAACRAKAELGVRPFRNGAQPVGRTAEHKCDKTLLIGTYG